MAKLKGRKAKAAALVLVAVVAVLGLPTQAAFAQDSGFDVNTEAEITNIGPGGNGTLTTTISPAAPAGGVLIGYENVTLGESGVPDFTVAIPAGGTQAVTTLAALGATTAGTHEIVTWLDQPGCTQDRFVCTAQASELQNEAASPGSRAEVDDTDVVTVNVNAANAVILDCSPDVQTVNLGADATITCNQRDQNGVSTTFPLDLEFLGGPADPTPGQQSPVDRNDPLASPIVVPGANTPGFTLVCVFVDANKATNDLGAEGPLAADGGDCAAEAVNPSADDADGTDVVCIAHGSGTCPGGTVIPPVIPPVDPPVFSDPVITGAGCANGIGAVTFRPIIGAELAAFVPAPIMNLIIEFQNPDVFPVAADDPDGGSTSLSASGGPSWISLEPTNPVSGDPALGGLRGIPSVADIFLNPTGSVILTAVDDEGASTTCVVAVAVGLGLGGGIPFPFGQEE